LKNVQHYLTIITEFGVKHIRELMLFNVNWSDMPSVHGPITIDWKAMQYGSLI